MQCASQYQSPLGAIHIAASESAITGLWFAGQKYAPSHLAFTKETAVLRQAKTWLDAYFRGEEPDFFPPLMPSGTTFQTQVWQLLQAIPYGQTTTYGQLAAHFPGKMSAQAIGNAVSRNPIAILIPCHRVLGTNGSLTGYAGGIDRKAWLLKQEAAKKEL